MTNKLAIVVGHELKSRGAVSVAPLSLSEYDYNIQIADLILGEAKMLDVDCKIFLRNGLGIKRCYDQVALWEPDAVVELHFNAAEDSRARGTETLAGEDEESKIFARFIHAQICDVFDRSGKFDRGVKTIPNTPGERAWFNVNSLPMVPNALVEPFFGSNIDDAALGKALMPFYAESIVIGFVAWAKRRDNGEFNKLLRIN